MCMPKDPFFCVTHPQKVFLGGFLLGYFMVKDSYDFGRNKPNNSDNDDQNFGLTKSPFKPVPYPYPYNENPRDSVELMLNEARMAYDAGKPKIIDNEEEKPLRLSDVHYDYESMRRKIEL